MEKKKQTSDRFHFAAAGNKRNPFQVPENYFEDVAMQWEQKTVEKQLPFVRRKAVWMYVAAVFAGLLLTTSAIILLRQQALRTETDNYELYLYSQLDSETVYELTANE